MSLTLRIVFAAILYAECFIGITLNVFIMVAHFIRWRKPKSLDLFDKILIGLGFARTLFLCHACLTYTLDIFFPSVMLNIIATFLMGGMFLHFSNLCMTTSLCVYYCVKITSYSHPLFILMKTKISTLIQWFALIALPTCLACSLPFGWYVFTYQRHNSTSSSLENSTGVVLYQNTSNQVIIFIVSSLPLMIIFYIAIYLLIRSLWMHTRQMKSGTSFQHPNLEAHFTAVKSMTLFLVCHILYFVCTCVMFAGELHNSNPWRLFNTVVICAQPCHHSAYIICSNRKLKKQLLYIFHGCTK